MMFLMTKKNNSHLIFHSQAKNNSRQRSLKKKAKETLMTFPIIKKKPKNTFTL
jgi:hypothetical protein